MTISQLQQEIILKLDKLNLTNPHLEADVLLSHVLKKPREWLLAHPKYKLNSLQIINYKLKISQRLKGISLAYIIGHKYFYGYKFIVNKYVLVPRPETEMFIDYVNDLITHNSQLITFIDVGTGSGCIIITLAKEFDKRQYPISNIKYLAVDNSKKALQIAKQNANLHDLENKIKFYHGNLLSPIINELRVTSYELRVVICANLPYLTQLQLKNSPSIQREPKKALLGGVDGLKYYRELFTQLKILENKKITMLCEIDPSQADTISQLIKEILSGYKFQIKKDLRGLRRLVIIEIKSSKFQTTNKH